MTCAESRCTHCSQATGWPAHLFNHFTNAPFKFSCTYGSCRRLNFRNALQSGSEPEWTARGEGMGRTLQPMQLCGPSRHRIMVVFDLMSDFIPSMSLLIK